MGQIMLMLDHVLVCRHVIITLLPSFLWGPSPTREESLSDLNGRFRGGRDYLLAFIQGKDTQIHRCLIDSHT